MEDVRAWKAPTSLEEWRALADEKVLQGVQKAAETRVHVRQFLDSLPQGSAAVAPPTKHSADENDKENNDSSSEGEENEEDVLVQHLVRFNLLTPSKPKPNTKESDRSQCPDEMHHLVSTLASLNLLTPKRDAAPPPFSESAEPSVQDLVLDSDLDHLFEESSEAIPASQAGVAPRIDKEHSRPLEPSGPSVQDLQLVDDLADLDLLIMHEHENAEDVAAKARKTLQQKEDRRNPKAPQEDADDEEEDDDVSADDNDDMPLVGDQRKRRESYVDSSLYAAVQTRELVQRARQSTKEFAKARSRLSVALFHEYNQKVFNGKLPVLSLVWSVTLRTTAGRCRMKLPREATMIELATKVCDRVERLEMTLAHEMCHAAVWILDGSRKDHHGPLFKAWAARFHAHYPALRIRTCHAYDIHYRFHFTCQACGYVYRRHSRSIDVDAVRCGACGTGRLAPAVRQPDPAQT